MTIRNLDALFAPKAVALVGASNQPGSVGAVLAANLLNGGFAGPVMPVNPHATAIRSTVNYRSVAELPVTPDLAIIATPPPTVPGLIAELGARGCRAAVVITAGMGVEGADGRTLRQQMLEAARPNLMRIVGPNCLGFISPGQKLNASFAHLTPAAGDLAMITQSGAVATATLDWAVGQGIGFSHMISIGDMSDVDFGDLLDYLALDTATRAILLYVEAVTEARKFLTAGRIAARAKPVIVIKSGRSEAGARAAVSHTGALAGSDAVYDAAFRRAGMLRVDALRDLFTAAGTLAVCGPVAGDRLMILTNGGGLGVIATDALERQGGRLASLSTEGIAALDAAMPKTWSGANPVDIIGDADSDRYGAALDVLLREPDGDAILVLNSPTAVVDGMATAAAVTARLEPPPRVPLLACWVGDATARGPRQTFAGKLPSFETPEDATAAFMQMVRYRRNQDLLQETPVAFPLTPETARRAARAVFDGVRAAGRTVLTAPEAKEVLRAYGIPVAEGGTAATPAEAAALAAKIGGHVALKILSPDITHKSDVGGVRLDLAPGAVAAAAEEMLARVAAVRPEAKIDGFTIEAMVPRPQAQELLAGIAQDATFGPILLFGAGGVATETIADRSIGLPPLNSVLAGDMIRATRIARLLAGYRDRPPADHAAITQVLVRLSEMVIDFPELHELDINPLLADADGVIAVDARIVLAEPGAPPTHLAVRPYPAELEETVPLPGGGDLAIRPIRPEDEPALVAMVEASTPEDRRLRFMAPMRSLPHAMAARLSQIDYDREMALVGFGHDGAVLGVARLIADPDGARAEFGVMTRSDLAGQGIGSALLTALITHARQRGIGTLTGEVLPGNARMLMLARELGFTITPGAAGDPVAVSLVLAAG